MTCLLTSRHRFASIEQLEALPQELGWPVEYRQLEPGPFSSTVRHLESDSWFLIEEQSNRSVEVVAGAPTDLFILALVEGDPAVVNGQGMHSDCVFLQSPGSGFRATLPAGLCVTQLGIAAEHFEGMLETVAPDLPVLRSGVTLISADPVRLEGVRHAMREILLIPKDRDTVRITAVDEVLADTVRLLDDPGEQSRGHDLHGANARLALDKASEYIDGHLGEPMRMTSVCRYARTTLRTLERIFAREVGISPQQYVKVRRLNACRRRLLAADKGLSVKHVARRCGFTHLGRFAGDYRAQFGESPRQTLLRS